MSILGYPSPVPVRKVLLVLVSALMVCQGFSINGLAAQVDIQQGGNPPLTCTSDSPVQSCDVRIVLLIDDSGSMRTNDPQSNRKKGAMHLVDALAVQYYQLASESRNDDALPDTQVAIVHFSSRIISNSGWIQIKPSDRSAWETQRAAILGLIDQGEEIREVDGTQFQEAFNAAADLLQSGDRQVAEANCIRRAILLFSDGTPEDLQYGILQAGGLDKEMADIASIVQSRLSGLDGIFVTAFKATSRYWNTAVEKHWLNLAGSPSQHEVPPVSLMVGKEYFLQLAGRMDEIAASLGNSRADQSMEDLSKYQGLKLELEGQTAPLQQGKQTITRFRFIDGSGNVVAPGGSTTSFPKLDVSVTRMVQESSLDLTQDGNGYQFAWSPSSREDSQFKVFAKLIDAKGRILLSCRGIIDIPVNPDPGPPIVLGLVIGSPRFPDSGTVTLPIRFDYEGKTAHVESLTWNHSAKDLLSGKTLETTVRPDGTEAIEYELAVHSIGDARTIQVVVGSVAGIDNQMIKIPDVTTIIEIPASCNCDGTWTLWFLPLAVLLIGLLTLLLVLRIRPIWSDMGDDGKKQYSLRNSDWQLLFLPWLVVFVLLLLNRIWWCCTLPPWVFLVLTILPIVIWILRGPWFRRTAPAPTVPHPPGSPLRWVIGTVDEPLNEISFAHNHPNYEVPASPQRLPVIEVVRHAPLKWTISPRNEAETRFARRL